MKRTFLILVCCAATACATSEPLPGKLEDQLKDQQPAQQRKILLEACLKEAGWQNQRRHPHTAEYLNYEPLCERMYKEMEKNNE